MISTDGPEMGPDPVNSFFKMSSQALWAPRLSRGSFTASVVIHGQDCSEKLVCGRGCWSLTVEALGNLPHPLGSEEG